MIIGNFNFLNIFSKHGRQNNAISKIKPFYKDFSFTAGILKG